MVLQIFHRFVVSVDYDMDLHQALATWWSSSNIVSEIASFHTVTLLFVLCVCVCIMLNALCPYLVSFEKFKTNSIDEAHRQNHYRSLPVSSEFDNNYMCLSIISSFTTT